MSVTILQGDAIERLADIPGGSVHCCVTSPPYYGLRDYSVPGQIGLEKSPQEYVAKLVAVFAEVRRVLKDDGTLWLNLGDSYCSIGHKKSSSGYGTSTLAGGEQTNSPLRRENNVPGLKPKDLIGIPWRVAFALQADGWWLRQDIIWAKPNPMPESVTDRCTRSHEYIFMLSKSAKYYYDQEAIKEPRSVSSVARLQQDVESQAGSTRANGGQKTNGTMKAAGKIDKQRGHSRRHDGFNDRWDAMERDEQCSGMRNKRDVWFIAPASYKGAHFATFPTKIIEPCILAGCPVGGTILDPFGGSGTTGEVAEKHGRNAILVELNPEYVGLAQQRINKTKTGVSCPVVSS